MQQFAGVFLCQASVPQCCFREGVSRLAAWPARMCSASRSDAAFVEFQRGEQRHGILDSLIHHCRALVGGLPVNAPQNSLQALNGSADVGQCAVALVNQPGVSVALTS